jgi:S1-C subfamily serine protease
MLVAASSFGAAPGDAPAVTATPPKRLSVVRVNVTNQAYDFGKPWGKRTPVTKQALGAVLEHNRVLVTGEMMSNATFVELELPDGSRKAPAELESVDYEANLALLKCTEPGFLEELVPLQLTSATVGDQVAVWQLEANGNLLATKGTMTTAEVIRYSMADSSFLIYKVSATLQAREGSYTVPIVKDDRLIGLLARYDSQSSSVDVIPTPLIEHFLKDAAQPPYKGFPRAGMSFAPMRDPQLRRYAGLHEPGGVYVTEVTAESGAGRAGLQKGDVIARVDGIAVDQDGNYQDATYGRIAISHLLSVNHYVGDTVKFSIWRKGEAKELAITLSHRSPRDYVSEPYIVDRPPTFYILGGMVFQELSRQYLREWGVDWTKKAPEDLVYMDRYQSELFKEPGRKIVFLSRVLPTDATLGYEDLHFLVVTKINGQEIKRLADVPAALAKMTDGIHKIEFDTDPGEIFLNAEDIARSDSILTKSYRLPALKRLE